MQTQAPDMHNARKISKNLALQVDISVPHGNLPVSGVKNKPVPLMGNNIGEGEERIMAKAKAAKSKKAAKKAPKAKIVKAVKARKISKAEAMAKLDEIASKKPELKGEVAEAKRILNSDLPKRQSSELFARKYPKKAVSDKECLLARTLVKKGKLDYRTGEVVFHLKYVSGNDMYRMVNKRAASIIRKQAASKAAKASNKAQAAKKAAPAPAAEPATANA